MQVHFLETGESPEIILNINGSLTVKGWDQPRLQINTASKEDMGLEQQEGAVTIQCNDNCSLNVPHQAILVLKDINGNASIKSLEGEIKGEVINGNIDLRSVGTVVLRRVEGNVSAKDVDGDMQVDAVAGNLTVHDIQGSLSVRERIEGNLNLYEADGNASASAEGNINLRLDPSPGNSYDFQANGNIICRLPEDVSAEVVIEKASKITVNLHPDLPGLEKGQFEHRPVAPYSLTLGEGDSKIRLSASGNVILGSEAPAWDFVEDIDFGIAEEMSALSESIAGQVEQQLESQMEMLDRQLEIQMEILAAKLSTVGLSEDEARRIEERSRQAAERATQRTQEKIRRAQERLEQKLAAAQRKAEQKARIAARKSRAAHRHSFRPDVPTSPGQPAGEPVSDEERLVILHMLEQKKITAEEAEQLLQALEGKDA